MNPSIPAARASFEEADEEALMVATAIMATEIKVEINLDSQTWSAWAEVRNTFDSPSVGKVEVCGCWSSFPQKSVLNSRSAEVLPPGALTSDAKFNRFRSISRGNLRGGKNRVTDQQIHTRASARAAPN